MVIDSHHHFWRFNPFEYGWIGPDQAVLRGDFLPDNLAPLLAGAGVDAVVSVQARQTVEETEWLLDFADETDFVAGVVGWVPLTEPDVDAELERLNERGGLVGVRHVLHDEPDDGYMLRAAFERGVGLLKRYGLAYDLLIFERHLPAAIELVDRHPEQRFVVDHLAKPRIAAGEREPWATHLRELARREQVWCKLSGVVTEADPAAWTEAQIRPYLETALDAFGPERLMFGSDWPVCLLGIEYAAWKSLVERFLEPLSAEERAQVMGGAARAAYRLRPNP